MIVSFTYSVLQYTRLINIRRFIMEIFEILEMIGGLALFLFGMNFMGEALEKRGGGKLKQIIENVTSSPLKGVLLG